MTTRYVLVTCAVAVALLAGWPANAAKEKFQRSKPHVNVGTIGHVEDQSGQRFTIHEAALPEGESDLGFGDKGDLRVEAQGGKIEKVYLVIDGRARPLHRVADDQAPQGLTIPGCKDVVWFAERKARTLIGFCAAGSGKRTILRASEQT